MNRVCTNDDCENEEDPSDHPFGEPCPECGAEMEIPL